MVDKRENSTAVAIGYVRVSTDEQARSGKRVTELRDRVVRWLSSHAGTSYTGEKMVQEFPEMKGTAVSVLLKPAIYAGQIVVEASRGRRIRTYTAK